MIPERREHVLVVQQKPDLVRKPGPNDVINATLGVQRDKGVEIDLERAALVVDVAGEAIRVCSVEPDPLQNESNVRVLNLLLGAPEPA